MTNPSNNTHHYSIDNNKANEILQNVLQNCDIKPNDITLNHLLVKHKVSHISTICMRVLAALLFLLTLFAPLAIPRPDYALKVSDRIIHNLNVIDYSTDSDKLTIYLNSTISLDIDSCYIETSDGKTYPVTEYNLSSATPYLEFTFPLQEADLYIFSQDSALLKAHLSPTE